MLRNRKFQFTLLYLIIITQQVEQRKHIHVQTVNRKTPQQPPKIKQLDLQQMLQHERDLKAEEVLKYMNLKGDNCRDFYDFACGKWLEQQNTTMAVDGARVSVQSLMEEEVNKELQAVLIEPITSLDSMDTRVAKDYYVSCLDKTASSALQRQFMRSFILNYGGLPDVKNMQWSIGNYNWIYTIANLRRKYDMDILIGLTIEHNDVNPKIAIHIEEPKTTLLPVELCSSLASRRLNENDKVFDRKRQEIKENLLSWLELTEANAGRKARAIMRFELDLCKFMRLEQSDMSYRKNISLHDLRHLSDYYLINFKDFVDMSLETTTITQVYLRNEEYFQQMKTLAQKGLESVFANYIMYRALYEINFPLNEKPEQRPFYCVNKIMRYLPQVLGKLYNDKYHLEPKREDIREVFGIIKQVLANHVLGNMNWMSDNAKKLINHKLKNLKVIFPSYPQNSDILKGLHLHDVLRGLPLKDDQNYWQKLQTIMMYKANQSTEQISLTPDRYRDTYFEVPAVSIEIKPAANELLVGYGLLQKPFYSHLYSKALKYSSIGVAIAREIIKIFDPEFFQQNSLNNNAGYPIALNDLAFVTKCFRHQISNYFHNKPYIYGNATKLYEIMMESSALNIAFMAYLHWLNIPGRPEADLQLETLPYLDFTNTQIFFINYAQSRCAGRHNVKLLPKSLPLFRRTWEEYDVNGPLINSFEFSRDFGCPVGLQMNLDDKCLLY